MIAIYKIGKYLQFNLICEIHTLAWQVPNWKHMQTGLPGGTLKFALVFIVPIFVFHDKFEFQIFPKHSVHKGGVNIQHFNK